MGRTSLTGGYSLEYLQDITLSGLQRLAKIHGLDENMQVQELIQELRAESDDEEDDAEYAHSVRSRERNAGGACLQGSDRYRRSSSSRRSR